MSQTRMPRFQRNSQSAAMTNFPISLNRDLGTRRLLANPMEGGMPRTKLAIVQKAFTAEFIKVDGIGTRLQVVARKADLLSFAITGLMEVHQDDEAWPLRDAADQIVSELESIIEEMQS